ncbi:Uu.00g031150.m01.CDS01 [Anthostomella pinea]|uniref:Uu.00g031150.m01.CDS01 n=1 Tax=Anthostomella pinea TaxID=933095 RepID=A0AAI8V914_9PEZI|nr:Uu.00g031150.m01.CDS01 [Anthostomella pinea]
MDSTDHGHGAPKAAVPRKPVPTAAAAPPPPSVTKKAARPVAPALACLAGTLLGTLIFSWRWIVSGAPLLLISLLLGEWNGCRVLPWLPLWVIFTTVNFAYAVVAPSWLLTCAFAALCYPAVILSCLFQFKFAAKFARRRSRRLLRHVFFVQDTVGLFDLPALEIDTDSTGLFVVRGLTISLSTLTATAYGIEVGVKLSDDMELAIQTDKVVIKLFRRIEIGDVYANIKGDDEMCFSDIKPWPNSPRDMAKDQFMATGTPILKVAMASSKAASSDVNGRLDGSSDPEVNLKPVKKLSPDDKKARADYDGTIKHILETSTSYLASGMLKRIAEGRELKDLLDNESNLRAAISAHMHDQPTIAHPPRKSIRLTTLSHNKHPKAKLFLHRLPFLYRLILNPISYFHPIFIKSLTSTGSGRWFASLMKKHFFKHYSTSDAEVRRLEGRISAWLADANFAVGLTDMYCTAHVPMDTDFDIDCKFKLADLKAHRTLPEAVNLTQVIHLGGADATFTLPSFLLPHHEHIMPSKLTDFEELQMQQEIEEAKGTPKAVQLQQKLERRQRDETAMKISAHGHLPALFDQQLLNFIAATVKATKVIEVEKGHEAVLLKRRADSIAAESISSDTIVADVITPDNLSAGSAGSKDSKGSKGSDRDTIGSSASTPASPRNSVSQSNFTGRMNQTFKGMNTKIVDGWRKAGINTVNAVANDRWIAKVVGNIMRKLENAQGDVGYSGLITLPLAQYREKAETAPKILP